MSTATPPTGATGQSARRRRRAVSPDTILAVLLPLVCVAALLVVRGEPPALGTPRAPVTTDLATASVVCPSALPGAGTDLLGVSTVPGGDDSRGRVDVGLGGETTEVRVRTGRVSVVRQGPGAVVVTGSDDLAPGLVAGRSADAPLAAVDCSPPSADQWFTAVGSSATHGSFVELVNPNPGVALADISVWSPNGLLDAPRLRGVSVPGGTSVRLDLGAIVPRRGELAIEVTTSRGRISAAVVDTYDELGGGVRAQDWLPGQAAPATRNLLLGLDRGAGERTLVVANPGESEVRASIKVVTPRSVFTPQGVEPVRVAAGTTQRVNLGSLIEDAAAKGAIGLLVEATGPATAALRQVVDGDLSLMAPSAPLASATAVVVPTGRKRLLLADPDAVGVATVTAVSADGERLLSRRVELTPATGANIEIPDRAVLVSVVPERTAVHASVLVVGEGTAIVPMRELVRSGLVPDVRPGLP